MVVILFRVINKDEYDELFKGISREEIINKYKVSSKNNNSFNYVEDVNYMHFFKFAEHARKYMHLFGNRIIMCDIPDDIIEQFGYGIYRYDTNGNILIPVPEYIIKRDDFKIDYIVKDRPKKSECIQYVNGINSIKVYNQIIEKLYNEFNDKYNEFDKYSFVKYALSYLENYYIDDILYWYSDSNNKDKLKMLQRNSR